MRLTLSHSRRRCLGRNLSGGKCVVRNDRLAVIERHDEHPRGATRVRRECVALEPLVQRRLAAGEPVQVVVLSERLRAAIAHTLLGREHTR